ncbi:MAG: glycosyltransferase family 39 protein [Caldilineaceae bacterium]|nr:glycosyltransferase family 39 protein [Caldilineaceae bacterium]MDE0336387.1 glycosyltransferase family 39 protein [Caldilineaceae bacterium]
MTRSNEQEGPSPNKPRLPADKQSLRAVVLIAVLIGFALRLYRLDSQELGELEGVVYRFRHISFSHLVLMAFQWEEMLLLPASFWLQNVWLRITGSSEFAIRSISAFCSVLAVPLTYRIAADIRIGAFATLAAVLLAAVNSYAIWHTQSVLHHSLGLALAAASILLALRLIGGVGGRRNLVAYVVCTASTFYTHAFAVLPLLAQNLYVLFLLARDRRGGGSASVQEPAGSLSVRWTVSQIAVGILCIPWLVSAWPSITNYSTGALSSPLVNEFLMQFGVLTIGYFVPTPTWKLGSGLFAFALLVVAILGIFLAERWAPDRGKRAIDGWVGPEEGEFPEAQKAGPRQLSSGPTVLLLLSFLVALLTRWRPAQISFPVFPWSYIALALTPVLLLLAIGLGNIADYVESRLGRRWKTWTGGTDACVPKAKNRIGIGNLTAALLILVVFAGNLFSFRNFHFESEFSKSRGLRELAHILDSWGAGRNKADVRFAQPYFVDPALWSYYYTGEIENASLLPWPMDMEAAQEAVRELRSSGVQSVILLVRSDLDLEEVELDMQGIASRQGFETDQQGRTRVELTSNARQALSSFYQLAGQETVGPWIVDLYSRPHPQAWRLFEVEFANGLTLERAQISPNIPPAGGRLVVHMEWSGDPTVLTGGETIFLHLLDEAGNVVAQWDPELRLDNSQVLKSVAMPIPPTPPDGPLRLIAGLYDLSVDGAPRIPTEAGEDSLLLVYFHAEACDACGR